MYVVCDLSNDPRGVIRLEVIFDKWEIFDNLLKIFGHWMQSTLFVTSY